MAAMTGQEARDDEMLTIDDDYLADSTVEIAGEIVDERIRAHRKHHDHSMEAWAALAPERYLILAEEVGEVAKEFNDATVESRLIDRDALRKELIQVATMSIAWVDAIDRMPGGEGISRG